MCVKYLCIVAVHNGCWLIIFAIGVAVGLQFRYYSEMLSSDALDNHTAVQLQNFRENNGGCLSGMTRYSDHLDDMPAIGYAQASIASGSSRQRVSLYFGKTQICMPHIPNNPPLS